MSQYPTVLHGLQELLKDDPTQAIGHLRNLCRTDLYFLLRYACNRKDLEHPWLFARCREVQEAPDGYIDLWAREHRKSTIITFGKTIQDILASHGNGRLIEREVTVGIFSHTRPIAKKFLRQIMMELETNQQLRSWFPDVLYADPRKESPNWSQDGGINVRRSTNPKEATVEAWGLVDSQPTSAHFDLMVYDDVVTIDSVRSPEMIQKTTESLELSYNLTTDSGRRRFIGTRYHFADTYRTILERKSAIPRVYPATLDGTETGEPVLMSRELLAEKRRDQGPYTYSAQMLLNPTADKSQGFRKDWLKFHDGSDGSGMNRYLLCDPANDKKKRSDYTVMAVIGLGQDNNYYLLDILRDRMNLGERTQNFMFLHRKWKPRGVGYEQYGIQSDIEHIKHVQNQENYRFEIIPLGGQMAKNDRIKRLVPLFEGGRFYLPYTCFHVDVEGVRKDLMAAFINDEYDPFPVSVHDDMLDCISRVVDTELNAIWPMTQESEDRYSGKPRRAVNWKTL